MPKIAAIQMCSNHVVADNLKTAASLISQAVNQQAQLVVLPENFALMGMNEGDKLQAKENVFDGITQNFLAEQAQKNKIWIVGGTLPLATPDPNKVYAATLVFNENGQQVGHYNKIHLFDAHLTDKEAYHESALVEGGHDIVVLETPVGRLGLAVCYDLRFPELARCLFNLGAEILAYPSAFTVPTGTAHWHVLTRSRAIENFCYVIGACQGGTHSNGRKTYGHSLIVEPWGQIVAEQANTEPGVVCAKIDLQKVTQARNAVQIQAQQKIFFDCSKL